MGGDDGCPSHRGGDDDGSNRGEEDDEEREEDEATEGLAIGEGTAEENEGRVGGAKKVEVAPGGEEGEQDQEGEGVGDEGDGEDGSDDGRVVDAKVREVLAEAGGGLGEGVRAGEGGAVGEFGPWAALGEGAADGVRETGEEKSEGGGGDGGCGCTGDGGGIGDGEGSRGGGGGHHRRKEDSRNRDAPFPAVTGFGCGGDFICRFDGPACFLKDERLGAESGLSNEPSCTVNGLEENYLNVA